MDHNQNSGNDVDEAEKLDKGLTGPVGSIAAGGSRAGLFRTPISGGVQSATSAHGLPLPALAVRNLMEQVNSIICSNMLWLCWMRKIFWFSVKIKKTF